MKCPSCGQMSPEAASSCQCGYSFLGQRVEAPSAGGAAASPALASLGARLLGQIVDALVAVGLALLSAVLRPALGVRGLGLGYLMALAYLLFADGFEGGQSLGKRLAGSAVVDAESRKPCSYGQSVLRNFLLVLLGPIDWIFIFGPRRQRLGDKAAGTIVIESERRR